MFHCVGDQFIQYGAHRNANVECNKKARLGRRQASLVWRGRDEGAKEDRMAEFGSQFASREPAPLRVSRSSC